MTPLPSGPDSDYPQIKLYLIEDTSSAAGTGQLLYASPNLRGQYGFSGCEHAGQKSISCYSPPQVVDLQLSNGPALPTTVYIRIEAANNQRNLQMPVPLDGGLGLQIEYGTPSGAGLSASLKS